MSETPHKPQETPPQHEQPKRLCDYCNDRRAVLYCRADSAKLCFSCDREVHSTNQLFSKHSRSQLCDICGDSPASIFCQTEHSVLCSNCDWENHTTLYVSPVHNRRPIESFNGCPSVTELLTFVGFDDLDNKALFSIDDDNNNYNYLDGDGLSEYFDWEANDFVSIDNLIVPSDAAHNYQALDVPSLPKDIVLNQNRSATCGQQKEEMLRQLRQLAKLVPNYNYENADIETVVGFRSLVPELDQHTGSLHTGLEHDAKPISFPDHEASAAQWFTDRLEAVNQLPSSLLRNKFEESSVVPDQHLETGGHVSHSSDGHKEQSHHPDPVTTETVPVLPKFGLHELNSQERDSAISRYKEKRKTRRYDKHIRYESRKVRAESRTRIKGRFAKLEQ